VPISARHGAFTLAEIDATLARLKAEYEKLNHIEEYGLGGRQGRAPETLTAKMRRGRSAGL